MIAAVVEKIVNKKNKDCKEKKIVKIITLIMKNYRWFHCGGSVKILA
jgi:hypothetical protein